MGYQKKIAAKTIEKKAGYVLWLKCNQANLPEDVKFYFKNESTCNIRKTEKDHGRIEQRTYYLEAKTDWLTQRADWSRLGYAGMVKTNILKANTGEIREECRYFLTSLTSTEAFADAVRKHWSIENQLHWQLDVTFREDASRMKKDNSPLNINIIRKKRSAW